MTFIKMPHISLAFFILLGLLLWSVPSSVQAEEGEDTIGLFSAWQETSSSASRAPKPLSQSAENITVITTAEIEALNAHTLADVLSPLLLELMFNNWGGRAASPFQRSREPHLSIH